MCDPVLEQSRVGVSPFSGVVYLPAAAVPRYQCDSHVYNGGSRGPQFQVPLRSLMPLGVERSPTAPLKLGPLERLEKG